MPGMAIALSWITMKTQIAVFWRSQMISVHESDDAHTAWKNAISQVRAQARKSAAVPGTRRGWYQTFNRNGYSAGDYRATTLVANMVRS